MEKESDRVEVQLESSVNVKGYDFLIMVVFGS